MLSLVLQLSFATILPAHVAQWAESNGIKSSSKVSFNQFSLSATENIIAGEELVSIPSNLALRDLMREDHPVLVSIKEKAKVDKIDASIRLVLTILEESANRVSPWHTWLNSLPSTLDAGLLFSEEDLAQLKGYDVYHRIHSSRSLISSVWTDYLQAAVPSSVSQDQFSYAYALVSGRRTVIQLSNDTADTTVVLLPFINSAGHSHVPNAVVRTRVLQEAPTERIWESGIAEFVLYAASDISQGSPITINFGFTDNYEGFLFQGVVQDIDELDALTFVVQEPSAPEIMEALAKVGIERLHFRVTPVSIPVSLLQYLRIINGANTNEETALAQLKKGSAVSMQNDLHALQELIRVLGKLKAGWGTTWEEDEKLLTTLPNPHQKTAVHLRMREKGVVAGVEKIVQRLWSLWLYQSELETPVVAQESSNPDSA